MRDFSWVANKALLVCANHHEVEDSKRQARAQGRTDLMFVSVSRLEAALGLMYSKVMISKDVVPLTGAQAEALTMLSSRARINLEKEGRMPRKLVLAPGVEFNEAKHEYWYQGRQLSGVTTVLGKWHGKEFKNAPIEEARGEGEFVHKKIQKWIETGSHGAIHPSVLWVAGELETRLTQEGGVMYSEVLVSDLDKYASAVDVVHVLPDGQADLYDLKRTFYRATVRTQLSIYKHFVERAGLTVRRLHCIAFREKVVYPVIPDAQEKVLAILYGGGDSGKKKVK